MIDNKYSVAVIPDIECHPSAVSLQVRGDLFLVAKLSSVPPSLYQSLLRKISEFIQRYGQSLSKLCFASFGLYHLCLHCKSLKCGWNWAFVPPQQQICYCGSKLLQSSELSEWIWANLLAHNGFKGAVLHDVRKAFLDLQANIGLEGSRHSS